MGIEYLRPDADDVDGLWTNESGGASLFGSIDESSLNDSDYIKSSASPVNDICRVRLSDLTAASATSPVTIRVRMKRTGTGPLNLIVRLVQGASTEIASWTYDAITDTFVTVVEVLTAPQLALITDFDDLFIEFNASTGWWLLDSAIDIDFQNNRAHDSIPVDSLLANTVLMLHGDGADASTSFSDSTGRHFGVPAFTVELDTAQSKFGGASMLFGGGVVTAADNSADFVFGTGDYTIDCWLRLSSTPAQLRGIVEFKAVQGDAAPEIVLWTDQKLVMYQSGGVQIQGTTVLTTGVWYHIALTRSGTSTKLFLDGVQEGSTYTNGSSLTCRTGGPAIGGDYGGWAMTGAWIDEFRIVKGVAAWTANFTPPSMPYNVGVGPYDLLSCSRASIGYAQTAAGTLTQFAANQLRITDLGLLIEGARTNVVLWDRDLTNAAWTASNITAAKNQTGPDGVANSASSITASAGNGTILQAITLASSARYQSAWVKRLTGSGTINMTMDNGSTWTAITVTAGWTKVEIPTQTLANPTVGFRIVTNGDAIAVDFVQNEDGLFSSSPIPTTTAATTRALDVVQGLAKIASIIGFDVPQSAVVDVKTLNVLTAPTNVIGDAGGLGDVRIGFADDNEVINFITAGGGGSNTFVQETLSAGLASTGVKIGYSQANSGRSVVGGGGSVDSDSEHGFLGSNVVRFGTNTGVGGAIYGYYRRVSVWDERLADATLQALTDPSGPAPTDYAVDLDFQNGVYTVNARPQFYLSCSRASIGYGQTAAGTLTRFAANKLRITDLGLLIEDARTNSCTQSQTFDHSDWSINFGITITSNSVAAPDGTVTADKIETSITGGANVVNNGGSVSLGAGARGTASFYVKSSSTWVHFELTDNSNGIAAWYNLASGVVGSSLGYGDGFVDATSIEPLADGWFRIVISGHFTAARTPHGRLWAVADADNTDASTAGAFYYAWGFQVEVGAFASSYIPTTTAAATRAADVVTCINALGAVLDGVAMSVMVDERLTGQTPAVFLGDGNYQHGYIGTNPYVFSDTAIVVKDDGNAGLSGTLGSGTWTAGAKGAFARDNSGRSLVGGGGTVQTDSAVPVAFSPKMFSGGTTTDLLNGYTRRLTAWNTRLADATLQGFTAP